MDNLPNGNEKRSIIQRVKDALPDWLSYDEHVKTAQLHLKNDLVPGVAPGKDQSLNNQEQPQE